MSRFFFLSLFSWQSLKSPNKAAEHTEIKAHMVGLLRRVKPSRLSFEQSPGKVSRLLCEILRGKKNVAFLCQILRKHLMEERNLTFSLFQVQLIFPFTIRKDTF